MTEDELVKKEVELTQNIEALKLNNSSSSSSEEQFVVFDVDNEEFTLNINDVLEITHLKDITRVPNSENYIKGVINLRGRIHVVISLAKKLGLIEKEQDDDSRIIIVESKDERLGMVVDRVSQVLKVEKNNIQIVPELLNKKIDAKYVKGVIPIDNRILIMLNTYEIINSENTK